MSNKGIFKTFFGGFEEYIGKLTPVIALTTLVFFFSILVGFSLGEEVSSQVFENILSNIPDPRESNSVEMFSAILMNNVIACILFVVSGLIVGVPPLMFMAFNGFFIGYISWSASQIQGLLFVVATILPHGIIEIPTILMCASMGTGLGYTLVQRILKRGDLSTYIRTSLVIFVTRIVPLLILAAGIETVLIYFLIS